MDKKAREGQRVRITWNFPVGFGKYANDVLWSQVSGTMGVGGAIHNLTVNGNDLEYPEDTVYFQSDSYVIIGEAGDEQGFLKLLESMRGGEIAVLRWEDSKAVVEKYAGEVWVFPGSEKEFTTEEVAGLRGLVGIDKLDWLL